MPINADVCGEKNTWRHDDGDDDGDDDCRYMQMFVLKKTHGGMIMAMMMVMVTIADLCTCLW